MERRKVQKTGGSTFTVSLPKKWAKKHVKQGEYVNILKKNDSLEISVDAEDIGPLTKTLDYQDDTDRMIRSITAHYLAGYDILNITSTGKIEQKEQVEKEVRKRLTGVESTPTDETRIELKNLLKIEDMPTKQVLRRCQSITESMFDDVIDSIEESESVDISGSEHEIDRLYMLGVRQLNSAVEDPNTRQELNIESGLTCIEYRLGFRFMERVADRLEELADKTHEKAEFAEVMKNTFDNYVTATEALIEQDEKIAEQAIEGSEDVREEIETKKENFQTVEHHIRRINAINIDLAELAINLAAINNQDRFETNQLKK